MAGIIPKQFVSEGLMKQTALAPVAKRVLVENRIHLFRLQHQKKAAKGSDLSITKRRHPCTAKRSRRAVALLLQQHDKVGTPTAAALGITKG